MKNQSEKFDTIPRCLLWENNQVGLGLCELNADVTQAMPQFSLYVLSTIVRCYHVHQTNRTHCV